MKKILIIFAHPYPKSSHANRGILNRLKDLPNVTISDLYEKYPYFHIDIEAEQKLLTQHDIIFFQHPLYWYSVPPLLKKWFDDVLTMGFAYGPGGEALKGKIFFQSFTTGGPLESYAPAGYNNFRIEDFFPPFMQTARLCQMKWIEPMIFHHATRATREMVEAHGDQVGERLREVAGG